MAVQHLRPEQAVGHLVPTQAIRAAVDLRVQAACQTLLGLWDDPIGEPSLCDGCPF